MLELFFTSSALILAVLLVRAVLGERMGARVRYAMWLLVLARLLAPVSLGQSAVSPANLARVAAPAPVPVVIAPQPVYDMGAPAAPVAPGSPAPVGPVSWEAVLPRLWAAGAAGAAAWFTLCNVRFWRNLRKTRRLLQDGPVKVYAARTATPCLFGVLRPAIYVTEAVAADPAAMEHVLLHERTHLRHGDQIWALLRTVCLAVWWFHPLVWAAASVSQQDGELCCDAAVIRAIGAEKRGDYGRTLLRLAGDAKPAAAFGTVSTLAGGRRQLKSRIRAIARWTRPRAWAIIAALALVLAAAGCAFSGAKPPEEASAAEADAEAALDALEASIQERATDVSFTIPADYAAAEWVVALVGGAEIDPAELDVRVWTPGETYIIHLPQGALLTMTAELPGAARRQWTFTGADPDAGAALEALGESIRVNESTASFELPEDGWEWDLHLYGRAVDEDGMSMSIHPLEELDGWMKGITYLVNLDGVTELHMLATLPGAAAREWTLVAKPALEAAFEALETDFGDEDAWALLRADRLEATALVFSELLANPGALDGLAWDDDSALGIRFRAMQRLLGGADMPLEAGSMSEWWDAYRELACRSYDWQSEMPADDSAILWQLAQRIYASRPAVTDDRW